MAKQVIHSIQKPTFAHHVRRIVEDISDLWHETLQHRRVRKAVAEPTSGIALRTFTSPTRNATLATGPAVLHGFFVRAIGRDTSVRFYGSPIEDSTRKLIALAGIAAGRYYPVHRECDAGLSIQIAGGGEPILDVYFESK